ncbi:unnamed protein product [Bemisia tabaci]|uniref:Dynein axonemal assembly factor 1 homolog n=1 Tax=Bemisia tabaci TaxID=7038 RepID=A0A9P0F636_BEMTA|nr:unnamed protein product [Bemisia tabaci]
MPISSGATGAKNYGLSVLGKPVDGAQPSNDNLLAIVPALPLLPAVPRPPRLFHRSATILGGNDNEYSAVALQTTTDGKVQASRSQKEKDRNPDRISLDRRGLSCVPVIAGEAKVRLISLQHNLITRLDNMTSVGVPHLVFLDLYDNQLDKISGIECLCNLRVLLLGKNRLKRIEGLHNQRRLEVLDVHGNQISVVSNLSSLEQLKVLNLAANQIRVISSTDLHGLASLQELNLRRNRISKLSGLDATPQLMKLFLSNNLLQTLEGIIQAVNLQEISIDGNPVSNSGDCAAFLVAMLPSLHLLSRVPITQEVRTAAAEWHQSHVGEKVILNARTNWQLLRSQSLVSSASASTNLSSSTTTTTQEPTNSTSESDCSSLKCDNFCDIKPLTNFNSTPRLSPELKSSEETEKEPIRLPALLDVANESSPSSVLSDSSSDSESSPVETTPNAHPLVRNIKNSVQKSASIRGKHKVMNHSQSRTREQGGDYLVEINGRFLNVYGQGAVRFIDRPWNPAKANDVVIVKFNYVNFNSLTPIFPRLKHRFPNVENFIFRETNIYCLGQLNALADVQGLTSLTIHPHGNSITLKPWRSYAVYRLSHWGLCCIDEKEVTEEEVAEANEEYSGLTELVLLSLPEELLSPLLNRLRLEVHSRVSAKQWLWAADPPLRGVVAKEALQWRHNTTLSQDETVWRHKGKQHLANLLDQTNAAVRKLSLLDQEWPTILRELIRDTLVDYSQLDSYMKKCMNDLKSK